MQPYIGQLLLVGFNFAPLGYLPCDGRSLSIGQYDALYSLLGTTYGGDGVNTFNLPDLRGRVVVGVGGAQAYARGQTGGQERVTLTAAQVAAHSHALMASSQSANSALPGNNLMATGASTPFAYATHAPNGALNGASVAPSGGGSLPHENRQPFQALNWVIAVEGIYPSRT
jgi:microcystin-dependent protein